MRCILDPAQVERCLQALGGALLADPCARNVPSQIVRWAAADWLYERKEMQPG